MTLAPLLNASHPIKIHVATVLPAFAIGTYQIFFSRKAAPYHRALGYVYLTLMTITAFAALFVHSLMPHGPFLGFNPHSPSGSFGALRRLRRASRRLDP
jgi:uncharacterized membrane protein